MPLYSNLLALEDEHGIAVGVINLPALGETVWAGRGLGCWSERGPARVADTASLDGAYVMSSSFATGPRSRCPPSRVPALVLRTWGDGYGYALVATGRAAAMVDPIVAPYDVGPMPVLLAEAGGRFTDLAGARHDRGRERGGHQRPHPRPAPHRVRLLSEASSYDSVELRSSGIDVMASSRSARARATRERIVPTGTSHTSAASGRRARSAG